MTIQINTLSPDLFLQLYRSVGWDAPGKEYPCGKVLSLDAAYGNVYEIIITGNYEGGFSSAWSESETEERIWNWKNTVLTGRKTI